MSRILCVLCLAGCGRHELRSDDLSRITEHRGCCWARTYSWSPEGDMVFIVDVPDPIEGQEQRTFESGSAVGKLWMGEKMGADYGDDTGIYFHHDTRVDATYYVANGYASYTLTAMDSWDGGHVEWASAPYVLELELSSMILVDDDGDVKVVGGGISVPPVGVGYHVPG